MSRKASPRIIRLLLALSFSLGCAAAGAQSGGEGHEQVRQAVHGFLESFRGESENSRMEIEVNALDPRLRIEACGKPLQTSLNRQQRPPSGRVTVRVECRDGVHDWSRYISANVRVFRSVVIASHALERGSRISDADVTLEETDISLIRGNVLQDPEQAVGQQLKRSVRAGATLNPATLSAPLLIERGDTVVLSAEKGPVVIRNKGEALQDGELGKRIDVRNPRSERVIQAVVSGPGRAKVPF